MDFKRLFSRIMITSFVSTFVCGTSLLMCGMAFDEDIAKLIREQDAIYEKFMESDEFSTHFKQEFSRLSKEYNNGTIDYEEYEKQVTYLQSIENAKQVLNNSSHELKSEVEKIDNKIITTKEKQESSAFAKASLIGTIGFGAVGVASTIPYAVMEVLDDSNSPSY